jgi:uncharacterized membrane protein
VTKIKYQNDCVTIELLGIDDWWSPHAFFSCLLYNLYFFEITVFTLNFHLTKYFIVFLFLKFSFSFFFAEKQRILAVSLVDWAILNQNSFKVWLIVIIIATLIKCSTNLPRKFTSCLSDWHKSCWNRILLVFD